MILGIDPGYATLGYAFLEGKMEPCLVNVGIISTSKEMSYLERILEIEDNLTKLIKQYQPKFAAVEKLFFKKNQKTAFEVAQARGVVLLTLAKHKLSVTEYSPLQVKKSIALKGNANKKQVQWMIKKILNLKETIKQDDAADALAIGLTHWFQNR